MMKTNHPIDFVVPWVDDSDPIWQKSFAEYTGKTNQFTDNSNKRFRDWDLFKYWFRGVEKFAPWVNKVHLITCGHHPDWLDINHPKLNFVKHEDYIPKSHLPVFNANPIEINLHRIKELNEHFVYFNDDIFIINQCKPTTFFTKGTPNDSAVLTALDGVGFSPILLNSIRAINKHLSKKQAIKEAPLNWFNLKYGPQLIRNILLFPWENFTGFYDYHLCNSYLKSTFNEVWEKESSILNATSKRKFRHNLDVNQSIFRGWQLAKNNFYPIAKHKLGDFYRVGIDPIDNVIKSIINAKKPIICLNDHDPNNIEETKRRLSNALNQRLPEKSSFEL